VLAAKIAQMALPLAPLVRVTAGDVHPLFPGTILNYWLLTSDQLDDLAHFYHQRTPCALTWHYPCPVDWKADLTLEGKRRKFGRFIGLRGCETPIIVKTEEEIEEEARRARVDEEEEIMTRKLAWY